MSRYVDPRTQYQLNNGDLATDGLLYFFENEDYLTPKNTFNALGAVNPNPVPLDGEGRVPEIDGTGLYSVRFTSSTASGGVMQWTVDNYEFPVSGSSSTLTSPTISGNITYLTAGARIRGDFSNSTPSNRVIFQSSTVNGSTFVAAIPNGTATSSGFSACNAEDPNNASVLVSRADAASTALSSTKTGTGSYLPLRFSTTAVDRVELEAAGNLVPLADNAYSFGKTSFRWSAIWAANGTIQTSDVRSKTNIEECSLGLDFINALEPISYKFIVGGNIVIPPVHEGGQPTIQPRAGVRTHWGLSSQQVKSVVDTIGVDFGGHVLTDLADPNSAQGLRYEQFIAPLIKAIQELTARIEELEAP